MFAAVKNAMDDLANDIGDVNVGEPCYRIAQSPDVGRHIVATKKLEKGEVVFKDVPIVTGPSRESESCCVACYKPLDLETPKVDNGSDDSEMDVDSGPSPYILCPRCKWPLCSLACADSDIHKPECYYLSKSGCPINPSDSDSLYDVITVLRCLYLKEHNIVAWADLLSLQEANPNELNPELGDRAKKVTGLICGTFRLGDQFPKELVFDICTRLDINSFEIPLGITSATVQGIFTVACMVEHNCIPTGHRCFNSDMSITVRSAYGAEEGDAVSICYTDSLWPTAARRENLIYSKDFLCTCDRCQDETENETYMSAIRCIKCPAYFLPENPLDCEGKWICNACGNTAPIGYSDMAYSKVASAIAKIEEEGLTPESCEKFIKNYSKVLHPNHAHMLDVKFSLLNLLGHSEGYSMSQLSEEQLQLKESLARTFLEIASKILPGISRLKGTALFELYICMQQRSIRAYNDPKMTLSPSEILGILQNAYDHLLECIECLQYEPSHQAEGQLCSRAREEQMQMILLMNQAKANIAQ